MKVSVNVPRGDLSYRFRIGKNKYITGSTDPQANYSKSFQMNEPGPQELLIKVSDFIDREKSEMTDWANIATFTFEIYDGNAKESLYFTDPANAATISKIEWVFE